MSFEWDEAKSERNARERGLPFEAAVPMFDGDTLEKPDTRREYGENRMQAIGQVEGRFLFCVYTWRGTAEAPVRRIISLRKAKRREVDAYQAAVAGRR